MARLTDKNQVIRLEYDFTISSLLELILKKIFWDKGSIVFDSVIELVRHEIDPLWL